MVDYEFQEHMPAGTLYLVGTPIGNRGDWSVRAPFVLKNVSAILAEDTRVTGMLCQTYGISTPLISFHEHNQERRIPEVIRRLETGDRLALVSDRGMPTVSDPGQQLVDRVWEAGLTIRVVPGPSAVTTAFAASGFTHPFIFWGFLPRQRRQRDESLKMITQMPWTVILYEAPHRIKHTLTELAKVLGADRSVLVAREMTKRFEEYRRQTLGELVTIEGWQGELVIVIEPSAASDRKDEEDEVPDWPVLEKMVRECVEQGQKEKEAIRDIASQWNINKRELYRKVQQAKLS